MNDRFGGTGVIEEGALKGRRYLLPNVLYVEKGEGIGGKTEFAKACIRHHKFVPDQGCPECADETGAELLNNSNIGL